VPPAKVPSIKARVSFYFLSNILFISVYAFDGVVIANCNASCSGQRWWK